MQNYVFCFRHFTAFLDQVPVAVSNKGRSGDEDVGNMRRILGALSLLFTFFLLCSLCGACCTTNTKPLSGPELAKTTDDVTVALVHSHPLRNEGVIYPYCTGVWVAQDTILTAAHCVQGLADAIDEENQEAKNGPEDPLQSFLKKLLGVKEDVEHTTSVMGLEVQFIMPKEVVNVGENPSAVHESKSFAYYKHHDLALLRVINPDSLPKHGVAVLAEDRPERGEQVSFNGHVKGFYWTFKVGYVSAYRNDLPAFKKSAEIEIDGPFMQVEAPIYYGDSGGGAFNNRGELVGIASFIGPMPSAGFYVPVEAIRGVLQAQKVIPTVLNLDPSAPDPKEYREQK